MQLYAFGGLTDSGEVLFVIFIVILFIYWANGEANRERYRRWEREQELERERQERAREGWEQSPDGQAYLDQRRREREEIERVERQRREAVAAEEARTRAAEEELAARAAWQRYHQSKTLSEIAEMTGRDFESFLARLLSKIGYPRVELTPINDQGGDILCESPDGLRTVVQAKRWKGKVGNSAVQELAGAMHYYGCKSGIIITNSTFTMAALSLAAKIPGVALHNCYWLEQQIEKHLPPIIPEFNWEEYNDKVKGTQFVRPPAALLRRLSSKPARAPKSSGKRRWKSRRNWRKW